MNNNNNINKQKQTNNVVATNGGCLGGVLGGIGGIGVIGSAIAPTNGKFLFSSILNGTPKLIGQHSWDHPMSGPIQVSQS